MYTRCPECTTCFRVTDRHLSIAKGKVRCGQCKHVFHAPSQAVDDLPINQLNAEKDSQVKSQTSSSAQKIKTDEKAKVVARPKVATPLKKETPAKASKKTASRKKTSAKKIKSAITTDKKPTFHADETMIADLSALKEEDLTEINLDSPSAINQDDENLFDDSFDLDAAINNLTADDVTPDANDDRDIIVVNGKTGEEIKSDEYIPTRNSSENVFDTDAYDSTSAENIEDLFEEMQGQLSLDIEKNKESEEHASTIDEFSFDEFDDFPDSTDEPFEKIQDEKFDVDEPHFKDTADEENTVKQVELKSSENETIDDEIILESFGIKINDADNNNTNFPELDIPIQLRDNLERFQNTTQPRFHPVVFPSFLVILLIISFTQITYFRAHDLLQLIPSSRPLLEAFCEKINCHYSGPRDVKKIQLTSRNVKLHPKEKKALLINAVMVNQATFAQPYPDIHIKLSDISGNVIAERIFNSKTYMGKLSNPFLLMKSRIPVHINFEVVDPGKDAINFEFTFL